MWKIGLHGAGVGNYNGFGSYLSSAVNNKFRIVLQQTDADGQLAEIQSLNRPGDVLVFRRTGPIEYLPYTGNPEQLAKERMATLFAAWPATLNPSRVWMCSINEPSKELSDRQFLARYELECCKIALGEGRRYLAFGWSTGTPEPEWWDHPVATEIIELCSQNPDFLGIRLHEYSLDANLKYQFPYLVGRYRVLLAKCDDRGLEYPTIVIGECGWKADKITVSHAEFMNQVTWLQEVYGEHPNVLGAAIWTLGQWTGSVVSDLSSRLPYLVEAAVNYTEGSLPEPPDPPEPDPPGPGDSLAAYLWEEGLDLAPTNDDAALQARILEDGWYPYAREGWRAYGGVLYVIQPAIDWEDIGTSRPRRLYYAQVPNWENIRYLTGPEGNG